ncbi:putative nuclease HARBI1 [Polypterus senegalus]|uniref:putative nuclease HARBI1 n=1 Tax=Polypterus senegalus TaxID=55291 RepID=UPI00196604AE|nr:putative nuclease HARBI1 [Polypterus senegalus]
MSRIMPHVLHAVISLTSQYITFPNTAAERTKIMTDFYNIAGFPSVIGAVDCTHVALKAPTVDEFAFVNRKGYHSINVQVICDAHLNLLNVVLRTAREGHTIPSLCRTASWDFVFSKTLLEKAGLLNHISQDLCLKTHQMC